MGWSGKQGDGVQVISAWWSISPLLWPTIVWLEWAPLRPDTPLSLLQLASQSYPSDNVTTDCFTATTLLCFINMTSFFRKHFIVSDPIPHRNSFSREKCSTSNNMMDADELMIGGPIYFVFIKWLSEASGNEIGQRYASSKLKRNVTVLLAIWQAYFYGSNSIDHATLRKFSGRSCIRWFDRRC